MSDGHCSLAVELYFFQYLTCLTSLSDVSVLSVCVGWRLLYQQEFRSICVGATSPCRQSRSIKVKGDIVTL